MTSEPIQITNEVIDSLKARREGLLKEKSEQLVGCEGGNIMLSGPESVPECRNKEGNRSLPQT